MELPYKFKAADIIKSGHCNQNQIDTIKIWLKTTILPAFPAELIAIFLISCDGHIENTKKTIEVYVRVKNASPDIFNNRNVNTNEKLAKTIESIYAISMPKRMPGNTVIHFFRLKNTSYSCFDFVNAIKLSFMVVDVSQRVNPPNDLIAIMDMKGAGIMHLSKMRVGAIKIFLEFVQAGMPLKIKQVYILNANYIFDKLLSLAKTFIKSELMAIIKTIPPGYDMNEFFEKHLSSEYMSSDYGGELPSLDDLMTDSIQQYRELEEFYEMEEKLRTMS